VITLATASRTRPERSRITWCTRVGDTVGQRLRGPRRFASIDDDTKQLTVADPADLDAVVDVGVTSGSLANLADDEIAISDATADPTAGQRATR
jgi:hypothetical protein